jgi:hypothetical protein
MVDKVATLATPAQLGKGGRGVMGVRPTHVEPAPPPAMRQEHGLDRVLFSNTPRYNVSPMSLILRRFGRLK